MKEVVKISIITGIVVAIGLYLFFIGEDSSSEFNFYRAEVNINQSQITETLFYIPNKPYHTLYRDFKGQYGRIMESILINRVYCSAGTPYFNSEQECYNNNEITPSQGCLPYTELNEYGCTFGNEFGFYPKNEYLVSAEYELNPENLIKINKEYYIKFIVYSDSRHKKLVTGNNFIINGEAITRPTYKYNELVIVYIPYSGDVSEFNIISQEDFVFDNKLNLEFIKFLFYLIPGAMIFSAWYFFGRENYEMEVTKRISTYPEKRKGWEVTSFFNSPFVGINPRLISTLLIDLHYRKIIDINIKEKKEIWIKVLKKSDKSLDEVEQKFIKILEVFDSLSKKHEDGYFKLDIKSVNWLKRTKISNAYLLLFSKVESFRKRFFSTPKKPIYYLDALFLIYIWVSYTLGFNLMPLFAMIVFIFMAVMRAQTTLFVKYKKDYYTEYKKWQAFRNFLKSSESMKLHGHKGTIIWGEILVYATALGAAKKVLKDLKQQRIINEDQYNSYIILSSPTSLSASTGGFGGTDGGAGGGAGGGGVGGGGGGRQIIDINYKQNIKTVTKIK